MASEACCKLAPVSHEYIPKGKYESIAGFHTCKYAFVRLGQVSDAIFRLLTTLSDVVGPEEANKGIIDAYDVFGMSPQTIQGADRLSAHTGAIVLIPDFFHGDKLDKTIIPPDTPGKKEQVGAFMKNVADIQKNTQCLLEIRKVVADKYPSAEGHWGIFGLCWGGKIAVLACREGNEGPKRRFNVSGTAHPG